MQVHKATISGGEEVFEGGRVRVTSGPHAGKCGEVVMIHSYPSRSGGDHVLVWVRLDGEGNVDAFAPERLKIG
ncbi:MAG TPA: KOW motif-containing protein [Pyrinomonadaceae bacterium]|nr:KOW motif-containing protein [Pyrinomonadaceae bacterium]